MDGRMDSRAHVHVCVCVCMYALHVTVCNSYSYCYCHSIVCTYVGHFLQDLLCLETLAAGVATFGRPRMGLPLHVAWTS